jgi:RNA polymerase sigma factor (sigma-70 family)
VEETDAAVIARSGPEPAAFGVLFDRHAAVLLRFLVRRVGPDTADGLLGECFRIAFEKRASYDPARPDARPWLYGIANNVLARHRRSEGRRLRATARLAVRRAGVAGPDGRSAAGFDGADGFDGSTDDTADRVAAALDARAAWTRLAEAVATLPDGERDALLLYVWEELSYEEVAAALAIPVGTVRSRLNRARRRLRELRPANGEEPVTTPAPRSAGGVGSAAPTRGKMAP